MSNTSIYDTNRLAQPDEVANYKRGDGIEKALLLANIIRSRNPDQPIELIINTPKVTLKAKKQFHFTSEKQITKKLAIPTTA